MGFLDFFTAADQLKSNANTSSDKRPTGDLDKPYGDRLTDAMLPSKDAAFDANTFTAAFPKALDAYMATQKSMKRSSWDDGRLAEKEAVINQLKTAAKDLGNLKNKQNLQELLERGTHQLTSSILGMETAGSKVLEAWLKKLNEDTELQANPRPIRESTLGASAHFHR